MNLNNLMEKLDQFFDLSDKKQQKKHDKLLKIIAKLESKKARLRNQMRKESLSSKNGKVSRKLCREFKVVTKLHKKAVKHSQREEESV